VNRRYLPGRRCRHPNRTPLPTGRSRPATGRPTGHQPPSASIQTIIVADREETNRTSPRAREGGTRRADGRVPTTCSPTSARAGDQQLVDVGGVEVAGGAVADLQRARREEARQRRRDGEGVR